MTHQPTTPSSISPPGAGTTLVLGGTGTTGRRVAERLAANGRTVRIGSRSGTPPFDWNDSDTWSAVLDGVEAAYVVFVPDLAFPGASDTIGRFSALAVQRGVRRLVLLSGRGEPEAQVCEDVIRNAGAEWTVVRASWFAQNFSESFLLGPVLEGCIALPAADVAEPFVDADDIADVVVAALVEDRHVGRTYEVTGPELLTFSDAAAEISRAAGRSVVYVPVSAGEFVAGAIEQGMPADEVGPLTDMFVQVLDGRNAHLGDGVQQALGRPATAFSRYADSVAATGIWATDERIGAAEVAS